MKTPQNAPWLLWTQLACLVVPAALNVGGAAQAWVHRAPEALMSGSFQLRILVALLHASVVIAGVFILLAIHRRRPQS